MVSLPLEELLEPETSIFTLPLTDLYLSSSLGSKTYLKVLLRVTSVSSSSIQ